MIQRTMASLWHWTQRVVEIGCRRCPATTAQPLGKPGGFSFTGGWEGVGLVLPATAIFITVRENGL
jgi:hypothetical protein